MPASSTSTVHRKPWLLGNLAGLGSRKPATEEKDEHRLLMGEIPTRSSQSRDRSVAPTPSMMEGENYFILAAQTSMTKHGQPFGSCRNSRRVFLGWSNPTIIGRHFSSNLSYTRIGLHTNFLARLRHVTTGDTLPRRCKFLILKDPRQASISASLTSPYRAVRRGATQR